VECIAATCCDLKSQALLIRQVAGTFRRIITTEYIPGGGFKSEREYQYSPKCARRHNTTCLLQTDCVSGGGDAVSNPHLGRLLWQLKSCKRTIPVLGSVGQKVLTSSPLFLSYHDSLWLSISPDDVRKLPSSPILDLSARVCGVPCTTFPSHPSASLSC
jgi:hypothetical protein